MRRALLCSCSLSLSLTLLGAQPSLGCDHGAAPQGGEAPEFGGSTAGRVQSTSIAPNLGKVMGLAGVGSVCEMFMGFDFIPGLDRFWKAGLNWIVDEQVILPNGVTWEAFVDFPGLEGVYAHPTAAWNAQALIEGYMRTDNQDYLRAALGAMAWLNDDYHDMSEYPEVLSPQGRAYVDLYPGQVPDVHFFSNTVFNQIGIGQAALDVYLVTGDQNALEVTRGVADGLVATADQANSGYKWRTWWPANPAGYLKDNDDYLLHRCAGGPGISEFLIQIASCLPPSLWNNDYEAYARGSLEWFSSQAVAVPGTELAYKWPSKEGESIDTAFVTQGRGAAGIGRAFLMAYQAFGDQEFLDYAVGAANWLIQESVLVPNTGRHWDSFLVGGPFKENNGWCIGQLGITQYLGSVHQETGLNKHGLAYLEAAAWMDNQTVPTAFGPMFPGRKDGDFHNADFFFGLSGLGNVNHETIPDIWTLAPALNVNVNALNFFVNSAIRDGDTMTWPYQIDFAGYGLNGSEGGTATEAHASASSGGFADRGGKSGSSAAADPIHALNESERITVAALVEAFARRSPEWASLDGVVVESAAPELFSSSKGFSVSPNPVQFETRIRFDRAALGLTRSTGDPNVSAPLQITDVSGRVVRVLAATPIAGMDEWLWDTKNEEGRAVAQGMYFGKVLGMSGSRVTPVRIAVVQ